MSRTWWLIPLAAIVGLGLITLTFRGRWRGTGLWAAAGLVGFAASLGLVDAGPVVAYQHYLPPWRWGSVPLPAALFGVYAAAVLLGLARWLTRTRPSLGGWRVPAVALAFVLTSATLSKDPLVFGVELLVAGFVQAVHLGAVALAVLAAPPDLAAAWSRTFDRLFGAGEAPAANRRPTIDRFGWAMAAFATVVPAILALVAYELHPHVPDEVCYLLHARYFAAGRLSLPVPEPFAAFDVDLMFAHGGRWYSPVPIGWPAVLAIGVRLGGPWLVNPILNGISTLLIYRLAQDLYDRPTARLGTLLFALSPWNLFLAMSLLTHSVSLAAGLAAAVGVAAFRRGRPAGLLLLAGAGIGMVSLVRPLEGLIVALCLGLWALGARPFWRRGVLGATLLAVGAIAAGAITLPYNRALTGESGRFPIMLYTDTLYGPGTNAMGFGPNRGLGWSGLDPFPGHGAIDVLVNLNLNFFALNVELLGWAIGSIAPLAWLLFVSRKRQSDWWMLAVVGAVVGVHTFYWFSGGPDFGPRYWYLIAAPCALLAARGVLGMADRDGEDPSRRGRVLGGAAILMAGSLLVFLPWRAGDKYHRYRGMEPSLRTLAEAGTFGDDVVLVRGRRHPDYAAAAVLNPMAINQGGPVFAWDKSPEVRDSVLRQFAGRRFWLVDGPTVTGDGYRVVRGPVDARGLSQP
ncbi:MAG: hypothetical protein AB7R55_14225 [Gemmatimonadales bacterium]